MSDTSDSARLAAIDQQFADQIARLDRHARAVMRGDVATVVVSLTLIAVEVIARPALRHWELIAALAATALLAAGGFHSGPHAAQLPGRDPRTEVTCPLKSLSPPPSGKKEDTMTEMGSYGSHSSEAEVRAEYEAAKRKVFGEGHGLPARIAVAALWIIRQRSIRRLRKMDRRTMGDG